MLVLTNQRIMTFGKNSGVRETVLVPLEQVKAVSVNAGQRSKGTMFQGGTMIVAAVFFYVLLAYWLTGRIDGPTVPIIRIDLVAFSVFLAWACKWLILRFGGVALYQRLKPFFIGMVVGFFFAVFFSFGVDCFWFLGAGLPILHG